MAYRLLLFFSLLLLLSCSRQPEPPNIVFILTDDLGWADLGFSGSSYYDTPHLNRLASQSMAFTRGYAASRVCSPSRASIMTGQFTARHGITDWIGAHTGTDWRKLGRHDKLLPAEYRHALSHEATTLPEALKKEGYKTFFAGKWHLGSEGSYPEDHGFDINVGGLEKGSPPGGFFAPFNNPKLEDREPGENLTMRLARETAEFIKSHKDSTFFAFLSFYAVHAPLQTTKEKWQKYRAKAEGQGIAESGFTMERNLPIRQVQDNPVYAGLVESVDDAVGLVLKTLEEFGLEDNTIVVFTSDNGGVASGDAYATSNLPLRGGKGYQWEGGIREPYLIKVPALDIQGQQCDVPVTGADFYPTLLDLAGLELRPQEHKDGVSLLPLLQGGEIAGRTLYWHYPHYGNQGGDPSSIIQEGGWKLIYYWEDGHSELYKLEADIGEENNLAQEEPETALRLEKQLLEWLAGLHAEVPVPDPEYNPILGRERQERIVNKLWPRLEEQRLEFLRPGWQPNEDWWGSE